jgi:uncharacterized membrane protein YraQ (UPF0718 family)
MHASRPSAGGGNDRMVLQDIQLMARIAVSIVLEAAPFLLLGSLLSAAVDRYVDTERIARRIPKGPLGRMAVGLLGGMVMPICECGSVPLARRLLGKGVPPLTAITYMLAAPVINPVVLLSTYMAFGGNMKMVLSRALAVAVSAALTGWICAGRLATDSQTDSIRPMVGAGPNHPHPHAGQHIEADGRSRWPVVDLLSSGATEFLDMGKYLVIGALASAAFKVFLPWQLIQTFAGSASLSIALLMLLAVLLCVCSEADAFVAASFVYAPPSAQLAFMAVGAMVDLKLVGMYFSAFPQKVAWTLIIAPVVCVFVLSNIMILLVG